MSNTYGVFDINGAHIDVSKSEKGAKQYATRRGYNKISIRYNGGYHVDIVAIKNGRKWTNITHNKLNHATKNKYQDRDKRQ